MRACVVSASAAVVLVLERRAMPLVAGTVPCDDVFIADLQIGESILSENRLSGSMAIGTSNVNIKTLKIAVTQ